uniref:Solute carrier family 22 member 7 n=1 Tax=Amazona collaria TaxID=241587 RepID=A0A8B9EYP9_9PSIT
MKFEDLFLEIGGFGRFQILVLFILCLPRINLPMHFLLHNFLAATPPHHCAIPPQEAFENLTTEEVLLISIPRDPDGTFRSCEMFSQPQFQLLLNSSLQPENSSTTQHCQHGWVYDHSQFTSTIATQVTPGLGIVDEHFKCATCQPNSGAFLEENTRDVTSLCPCLKPCRPLPGGALCVPAERCLPLAGMEWVDIQHRTFSGILTSIFWSIGNMLLAMVAYLVREWHWLLVAVTGPCLLSIVLPLHMGWEVLQFSTWISLTPSPHAPYRFGVAFSYYGMSMNLTGFGLNMYLSQFVFGVIEIPAKIIMYVLVNRVGRRQSQAWSLILTGLCIGANIIIPKPFTSLRSIVAIMGKGFSESAFTTVFLYTSELYPTVLRQNGMGYTSFVARLGGALAPLVFLLDEVWRSLPEVTYCGVAVCCGSVAFLLPETLNVCLPEGIEDVEKTQTLHGIFTNSLLNFILLTGLNIDLKFM